MDRAPLKPKSISVGVIVSSPQIFFCAKVRLRCLTCKGQCFGVLFFFFRCSVIIHIYTAGGFHASST